MPRRRAAVLALIALLALPLAAQAQPATRVYRIGFLGAGSLTWETESSLKSLRAGLRERGYVEGQTFTLESRWAEGKLERLPSLAGELIGLPVDLLVAASTAAIRAAKDATRTTPVVFVGSGDPVGAGLIASLGRPGGNLTGLTYDAGPELSAKWLDLAAQTLPGLSRVAVVFWDADPAHPSPMALSYRTAMESAARSLKLTLHWTIVRRPEEFPEAFAAIERARPEALVWCFSHLPDRPVLDFAARHRLPAVGCWRQPVTQGALMSYHPSGVSLFHRAAGYIDRILKGAKPADLPVEQPTKFELVINLKTARALGLTIPPAVLARADEVIE